MIERSFTQLDVPSQDFRDTSSKSDDSSENSIRRFLDPYEIGGKIKHLRTRRSISLVDLGKSAGLSASMLSQLENGKLIPTLPTLTRIALAFDVGMDYFFTERRKRRALSLVRRGENIRFPEQFGHFHPANWFECIGFAERDKSLQAYTAEFPLLDSRSSVSFHLHAGTEFIHVLEGSVVVDFGDEQFDLQEGDSFYFDSGEPHGYRGASSADNRALVVTTPPRI